MPEENKRNIFAVAGFALSFIRVIVGIVVWIRFFDFPNLPKPLPKPDFEAIQMGVVWILFVDLANFINSTIWPIAILRSLEVLGITLSSVGIAKARKGFGGKKLAIAGLVLGIIALLSITSSIPDLVRDLFS